MTEDRRRKTSTWWRLQRALGVARERRSNSDWEQVEEATQTTIMRAFQQVEEASEETIMGMTKCATCKPAAQAVEHIVHEIKGNGTDGGPDDGA